ncbi:MAG: hypothetical protein KBS96_01570 [Lachnospiraceae bacterium]|nr:hypothetical protein [Candidatus Colinaster scatohippi]
MKNKSKLNKIKTGGSRIQRNWFYMSEKEISPDDIKSVWEQDYDVEIWREQGILEITLGEGGIDVETCPTDRWDDYSKEYLKSNSVVMVYAVTVTEKGYEECVNAMRKLCSVKGGWFAADTDDFTPRIE